MNKSEMTEVEAAVSMNRAYKHDPQGFNKKLNAGGHKKKRRSSDDEFVASQDSQQDTQYGIFDVQVAGKTVEWTKKRGEAYSAYDETNKDAKIFFLIGSEKRCIASKFASGLYGHSKAAREHVINQMQLAS